MIAVRLLDRKLIHAKPALLHICVVALRAALIEELAGGGSEVRSMQHGQRREQQGCEEG